MLSEKRGGATSWTRQASLTFQPVVPSTSALKQAARRNSCPALHAHEVKTETRSMPDSSLTSLGWLQNLKVFDMFSPEVRLMLHPPSPSSEDSLSWETVSSYSTSPPDKKDSSSPSADDASPLYPVHKCIVQSAQFKAAPKRYRSDPIKPPFSYTSLIYLALQQSRSGKCSLHDICRWIKTNFRFFREAESGWQTSIRQNLSLNELFTKVPRSNGDSSKSSCWTISPQWREWLSRDSDGCAVVELAKGDRKLKQAHSSYTGKKRQSGGTRKRVKSANQQPVDPCGLPGDLDWISLLSSQRVSCGSCPSQACRPVYGSPVLGPPDLGHVGDPMVCSPLILPATITSRLCPHTPVVTNSSSLRGKELDEDIFTHDSPCPSPHVLPWADSRPQSPNLHPWAESKETTLKNLGQQNRLATTLANRNQNSIWSPEASYSSCSTTSVTSLSCKHKPITSESYIY